LREMDFSMGFVLDFDARNNILRVTVEGRVTDAILLDFYATTAKYVASHPCRGILDFSEVTEFEASSDTIRKLAATPPAFPPAYMRVFVSSEAFIYGMGRMFQMLSEKARPNFQVVHTMDEAYRLLRVESPEFSPVS